MKQLKLTIALAAMALFTTTGAYASLIGDNVTLNIYNVNTLLGSGSATVGAGTEFSSTTVNPGGFFISFIEGIDLTSNSINLIFQGALQRSFEITGIDALVNGATSSSGTVSNITFTDSSVRFLYTAGDDPTTGTVNLTFGQSQSAIPEPGTTALLVSGLAGIFFYRRKR
jgi:hypothetical protein